MSIIDAKVVTKQSKTLSVINKCGVFIDSSGSTAGAILQIELSIAKHFHTMSTAYVSWNTYAKVVSNPNKINSTGLTYPDSIFAGESGEVYKNCNTFVIITDGAINTEDVTKFNSGILQHGTKGAAIGFIVGSNTNVQVSVLAPLFNFNNFAVFHFNSSTMVLKVLCSKNILLNEKPLEGVISLDKLSKMTYNDIEPIPFNSVVISEDEKTIKYVSIDNLKNNIGAVYSAATGLEPNTFSQINWEEVCRLCKMQNTLGYIRELINNQRSAEVEAIQNVQNELLYCNPLFQEKEALMKQILELRSRSLDYSALSNRVREITSAIRAEDKSSGPKKIQDDLTQIKEKWNNVRDILFHYEKSTYAASDFVYASNRVKRAKVIDDDEEIPALVLGDNVPKVDCVLCMSPEPIVLWITRPTQEQKEMILSDYALNYPLGLTKAKYDQLFNNLLVPNPVCGDCADSYIRVTDKSVYRVPISGYLPVNVSDNRHLFNRLVYDYFCDKKVMPHIKQMLFAFLDGLTDEEIMKKTWLAVDPKQLIAYFKEQLLDNTITTQTFSEDGNKVTLRKAMELFPPMSDTKDQYLLRQPISAVLRIFNYSARIELEVETYLRSRLWYHYIERFSAFSLRNGGSTGNMRQIHDYITNLLFNTWCGCPIIRDLSDIKTITNAALLRDPIFGVLDLNNLDDLFSADEIRFLLFSLSKQKYDKPSTINNALKSSTLTAGELLTNMIGSYSKRAPISNPNEYCPCYSYYNGLTTGPSKFYYGNIYLGSLPAEELTARIGELLTKEYGKSVPDRTTMHFGMHRIIASVLEEKHKDATIITPEMLVDIVEAFKKTEGRKGNIYDKVIEVYIACAMDFLNKRAFYNSQPPENKWPINIQNSLERVEQERTLLENNIIEPPMEWLEEKYADYIAKNAIELIRKAQLCYVAVGQALRPVN